MIKISRWGTIFRAFYLFAKHCFCEIYCIFVKLVTMLAIYAIIAIVTYHAKHPINKTNEYFNNFSYRLILTKNFGSSLAGVLSFFNIITDIFLNNNPVQKNWYLCLTIRELLPQYSKSHSFINKKFPLLSFRENYMPCYRGMIFAA